jgi:ABC-type uncharacterized transport system substrate-binding protein
VFIDATIEVQVDSALVAQAVKLTWVYDEYYTLLLLGDLGLDPDGDGALTPDEQAKLLEAESNWDPQYEGDTYGALNGAPVALGAPKDFAVSLKDGKITSVHVRPLAEPQPLAGQTISWKSYDPWYYAAFTLSGGLVVTGAEGCDVSYIRPDLNAAYNKLDDMLYGPGSTELEPGEYPQVGAEFADEAVVTCAAPG